MREQQRRSDKQNSGSRTHPSRVSFFALFFSPDFFFQGGKHRQSLAHKPLFLSLVDMPAHWGGLVQKLDCAAHSQNSQPIKNFHRLGEAVADRRQVFVVLLCYASFMKKFCECQDSM